MSKRTRQRCCTAVSAVQWSRAHQPPPGEDADAGADALGLREQVRVDEEGGSPRELGGEQLADLHPPERIDAVGGLVEHQEIRRADQRCGEPEALAHALAEPADSPLRRLGEADPPEQRVQPRGDHGRAPSAGQRCPGRRGGVHAPGSARRSGR